jgi:chlorobactene glucosyltransferase
MLIVLTAVFLLDVFVLVKLIHAFRLLSLSGDNKIDDKDLPTVSVCIPARNETHAMTQCLERVVASDYPKLEVIVLDDGSRDDTSLLIKSFAHAGVRFVEGKPLPDGWLGKNYAQSILVNEASGKIVLFMDVDTLIEHHTLRQLVERMLNSKTRMMSIIPTRNDSWQNSTLMTPMRYFWAMVRHMPGRPRAVSNAWLVERQFLMEQFESDKSLQMSMLLETSLARKLAEPRAYQLVLSNKALGLRYEKRWSSQVETSIRILYPQCDAYTLQVAWLVLLLALTLVPYVAVFWQPWALVLIVLQYVIAYYYLTSIWTRYRWIGALILPATVAQEMWLMILSTYHYKRGTVTWKGRPITAPMQHHAVK